MRKQVISLLLATVMIASVSVAVLADELPAAPEIEEIEVQEVLPAPETEEPAAPVSDPEEQFDEIVSEVFAVSDETAVLDGVAAMGLSIVPVKEAKVAQTKTVEFAIKVTSDPAPFCALWIELAPTDTDFSFVSAVCNISGALLNTNYTVTAKTGILIWFNNADDTFSNMTPKVGDTLVTFTLKAAETAAVGTGHSIGASVKAADFESGGYVELASIAPCAVEVTEKPAYLPGDINDDSEVDGKDITRLRKYLADETTPVVEEALDINGDGEIDGKDITRLRKYLADDSVQIF